MILLVFIMEVVLFWSFVADFGFLATFATYFYPTLLGLLLSRYYLNPQRIVQSSGYSLARWVLLMMPFISSRLLFVLSFLGYRPGFVAGWTQSGPLRAFTFSTGFDPSASQKNQSNQPRPSLDSDDVIDVKATRVTDDPL